MTPTFERPMVQVYLGEVRTVLQALPAASVQCVVTSPPYWGLRSYLHTDDPQKAYELGNEAQLDCVAWATGAPPCGQCYLCHMLAVFQGVWRVLRGDGQCWINLGDSYASTGRSDQQQAPKGSPGQHKAAPGRAVAWGKTRHAHFAWSLPGNIRAKSLCLLPQRFALAMQAQGWLVRQVLPWIKRSALPESVHDRPTTALEWWYMFTKSQTYFCDMAAVRQVASYGRSTQGNALYSRVRNASPHDARHTTPVTNHDGDPTSGRNFRNTDLWFQSLHPPHGLVGVGAELVGLDVVSQGYPGAHLATFSEKLIVPLIQMGSREGDTVLDPFAGSGTTLAVARALGRRSIGVELSAPYLALIAERLQEEMLPFW